MRQKRFFRIDQDQNIQARIFRTALPPENGFSTNIHSQMNLKGGTFDIVGDVTILNDTSAIEQWHDVYFSLLLRVLEIIFSFAGLGEHSD